MKCMAILATAALSTVVSLPIASAATISTGSGFACPLGVCQDGGGTEQWFARSRAYDGNASTNWEIAIGTEPPLNTIVTGERTYDSSNPFSLSYDGATDTATFNVIGSGVVNTAISTSGVPNFFNHLFIQVRDGADTEVTVSLTDLLLTVGAEVIPLASIGPVDGDVKTWVHVSDTISRFSDGFSLTGTIGIGGFDPASRFSDELASVNFILSATPEATVAEPGSLLLIGSGLFGLLALRRRRD